MVFDWLPVVLALTSACLFAIGAHFQHIGLVDVHARAGTAISISSAEPTEQMVAAPRI